MMAAKEHAYPTPEEELNRKVMETADSLMTRFEDGRITRAQFVIGMKTLWDAAAGLVERGIMDILSEVREEIDDASYNEKHILRAPTGAILIITHHVAKETVTVHQNAQDATREKITVKDFAQELNGSKLAVKFMSDLINKALSQGYTQL